MARKKKENLNADELKTIVESTAMRSKVEEAKQKIEELKSIIREILSDESVRGEVLFIFDEILKKDKRTAALSAILGINAEKLIEMIENIEF